MSSLERVVERLIQVRTVECPHCGLRVTVKNPRWKRVTCKGCGHKINIRSPFTKQYVVDKEPKRGVPLPIVRISGELYGRMEGKA